MPNESPSQRQRARSLRRGALVAAASLVPLLVVAWIAVYRDQRVIRPRSSAVSRASPIRSAPPTRSAAPRTVTSTDGSSELEEIAELRRLGFADPERSLALVQSWSKRASNEAPAELMWFEARALVELGRFDEARAVARAMLERHPSEPWTMDARRHLLSHPFGLPPRGR